MGTIRSRDLQMSHLITILRMHSPMRRREMLIKVATIPTPALTPRTFLELHWV